MKIIMNRGTGKRNNKGANSLYKNRREQNRTEQKFRISLIILIAINRIKEKH